MEPTVTDQTAEELADLHEQLGPYESVNDAIAAAVAAEREACAELVERVLLDRAHQYELRDRGEAGSAARACLTHATMAIRNRGGAS